MSFQFGLIDNIDYVLTFWCFIIVIVAIVLFENVTGILDYFLSARPIYNKMVEVIYKELTFMGLVSLAIILFEAGSETLTAGEEDTILAIDFAHITLFFLTIFFVVHAFLLIRTSLRVEIVYRQFLNFTAEALVEQIMTSKNSWHRVTETWGDFFEKLRQCMDNILIPLEYLPSSSLRYKMELNIIHSIFQSSYRLPKDFKFPAYLSGCFARFALKVINRSVFSWFSLIFLLVLNIGRIGAGKSCQVTDTAEHRRLEESSHEAEDAKCERETITYFLFCGAVLMFYTLVLVFVSRLYIVRFMRYAGIDSAEEHIAFLKVKHEISDQVDGVARFSAKHLAELLEISEDREELVEEEEFREVSELLASKYKRLRRFISSAKVHLRMWLARGMRVVTGGEEVPINSRSHRKMLLKSLSSANKRKSAHSRHGHAPGGHVDENELPLVVRLKASYGIKNADTDVESNANPQSESNSPNSPGSSLVHEFRKRKSMKAVDEAPDHVLLENAYPADEANIELQSVPKSASDRAPKRTSLRKSPLDVEPSFYSYPCLSWLTACESKKPVSSDHHYKSILGDDMSSIYIFSNPTLYYRAIELCLTFNCLYMAVWITNMITIVTKSDILAKGLVQFALIIPFLFCFRFIAYITETYSLLDAISEPKLQVVKEVLEEMHDTNTLIANLRCNVRRAASQCTHTTGVREFVGVIFEAIDRDGSGHIDADEFRGLLHHMDQNFSERRFKLLFYGIDEMQSGDGKISKEELQDFFAADEPVRCASDLSLVESPV